MPPRARSKTGDGGRPPVQTAGRTVDARRHLPFSRDVPTLYHETYLRLMPRDQHHLFSFWEIAPEALRKARGTIPSSQANPSRQQLKVYEVERRPGRREIERHVGDIALEKNARSQYIRVPHAGTSYRIEYCVSSKSGGLVPLCRSAAVAVPPDRTHRPSGARGKAVASAKLFEISSRSSAVPCEPSLDSRAITDDVLAAAPTLADSEKAYGGGSHFFTITPSARPDA